MPPNPKRRRRRLFIVIGSVALLLGVAAWYWLRPADNAVAVQVDKVTRRDLTETVVANGRIQPVMQVLISPEVAGEIVELPVTEGQTVKKGDLLVQVKPDTYKASRNSAEANYKFALGSRSQAEAELARAESDFHRSEELAKSKLIPDKEFTESKTVYELAKLRLDNSIHQVDQAKFALDKAEEDLAKTTITSPIDGTITKLKSQLGERVLGTSFNVGTEIMTVARLNEMEARVDIGEVDIVLIQKGQNARLEVDAFRDRKFKGTVTAIANASKSSSVAGVSTSSQSQEAPKFEVRIRIDDQEAFRPGMSVTAEIETRSRKNALAVPIQAVTTRLPKSTPAPSASSSPRPSTPNKPVEVVFALEGNRAKQVPVTTGISDSEYFEIVGGLEEGREIITGGYKAVSKDLEDNKLVKVGGAEAKPTAP